MKCLSIILLFVFLIGCKVDVDVENENPLAGTTWEMVSAKNSTEGFTWTYPDDRQRLVLIFGKTHYSISVLDTSRKVTNASLIKYTIDGENITTTSVMFPHYEDIGRTSNYKIKIEGDQLIQTGEDLHFRRNNWKVHQVWKRID